MSVTEGAPGHGKVAHLLPQTYKRLVSQWLEEDTPSLDYGGFVVGEDMAEARLLGKSAVSIPHVFSYSLAWMKSMKGRHWEHLPEEQGNTSKKRVVYT